MLDLHRLRLLREVKLRGSMSAAARELSYSHSAISQQLTLLEKETGVALLERAGRRVALTEAGEELVRNTDRILAAVERAESDLQSSHPSPRGIVRVSVLPSIAKTVLPAALHDLAEHHPGLEVHLLMEDPDAAMAQLVSRRVDAVILDTYPGTEHVFADGVHVEHLATDPVHVYWPAPQRDTSPASLEALPWAIELPDTAARVWAMRLCRERGIEPRIRYESADLFLHLRLVEAGLAAAFLPDLVSKTASQDLIRGHWLSEPQHRDLHYVVRDGAQDRPALRAVREAISRHV